MMADTMPAPRWMPNWGVSALRTALTVSVE
jgi:hypothetical protein